LRRVPIKKGQALLASNEPEYVYFLEEGVASFSLATEVGKYLQLSIVGNESMIAEAALFNHGTFNIKCSMLSNGSAHKMVSTVFRKEFNRSKVLRDLLLDRIEARLTEPLKLFFAIKYIR
jgi:CRP-like cAMP-binding protein